MCNADVKRCCNCNRYWTFRRRHSVIQRRTRPKSVLLWLLCKLVSSHVQEERLDVADGIVANTWKERKTMEEWSICKRWSKLFACKHCRATGNSADVDSCREIQWAGGMKWKKKDEAKENGKQISIRRKRSRKDAITQKGNMKKKADIELKSKSKIF